MQHVLLAHPLRLVLHGGPPHQGVLQVLQDAPVNLVAEVLNRAPGSLQHNRRLVVGKLTLDCKNMLEQLYRTRQHFVCSAKTVTAV